MPNPTDIDVEIDRPRGTSTLPPPPGRVPLGREVVQVGTTARPHPADAGRLGDAADVVGRQVGRAYGYVRSRPPRVMRADAERAIVDNGVLALTAALGLGYLVGRFVRR